MFNKHLQAKVNRNYTSSETSLLLQNPLQVLSQLTVVQIVLLTHVLTRQLLQTHCHVQLSSLALSLSVLAAVASPGRAQAAVAVTRVTRAQCWL